jgi:SAM-dependent methyltransferase
MFSQTRHWRDEGYKNIYGTATISRWCSLLGSRNAESIRVLDIGCGDGRDLLAISAGIGGKRAVELFGIERTEQLAIQARQWGITTSSLDLESERLPFSDRFFDVVTANQVMEHLKNSIWALHEIVRVTKRDGLIIIGVPNLAALHNRLLVAFGRQPSCLKADGPHVRGFTLHELRRLVHRVDGIDLISSGGTIVYGFPPYIGKLLGRLLPALSATVMLAIRKTADQADILSLLGEDARFETNFCVGPVTSKTAIQS